MYLLNSILYESCRELIYKRFFLSIAVPCLYAIKNLIDGIDIFVYPIDAISFTIEKKRTWSIQNISPYVYAVILGSKKKKITFAILMQNLLKN